MIMVPFIIRVCSNYILSSQVPITYILHDLRALRVAQKT